MCYFGSFKQLECLLHFYELIGHSPPSQFLMLSILNPFFSMYPHVLLPNCLIASVKPFLTYNLCCAWCAYFSCWYKAASISALTSTWSCWLSLMQLTHDSFDVNKINAEALRRNVLCSLIILKINMLMIINNTINFYSNNNPLIIFKIRN